MLLYMCLSHVYVYMYIHTLINTKYKWVFSEPCEGKSETNPIDHLSPKYVYFLSLSYNHRVINFLPPHCFYPIHLPHSYFASWSNNILQDTSSHTSAAACLSLFSFYVEDFHGLSWFFMAFTFLINTLQVFKKEYLPFLFGWCSLWLGWTILRLYILDWHTA